MLPFLYCEQKGRAHQCKQCYTVYNCDCCDWSQLSYGTISLAPFCLWSGVSNHSWSQDCAQAKQVYECTQTRMHRCVHHHRKVVKWLFYQYAPKYLNNCETNGMSLQYFWLILTAISRVHSLQIDKWLKYCVADRCSWKLIEIFKSLNNWQVYGQHKGAAHNF